jgi:beta-lactamase regulating signal transducer with metallopeptidase domain
MDGAALTNLGARVTALLALTTLALFALRRGSAATRHLVAVAGLAAALALPLLSGTLPKLSVPLPVQHASDRWDADVGSVLEAPLPDLTSGSSSRAARPHAVGRARRVLSLAVTASAGVWGAVAALLLLRLGMGMLRFSRMARGGEEEQFPELGECRDALRLRRVVRVLRSAQARVPMTAGALEPVILLPRAAVEWTAERRRLVLLHELAHVKRLDGVSVLIAELSAAIWWFHPLAWLVLRWSRQDAERATDDVVVRAGEKPSIYARHLLEIAQSLRSSPAMSALPMTHASDLEGRLRALLDSRGRGPSSATGRAVAAGLAGVALLLAISRPIAGAEPANQLCAETRARLEALSKAERQVPPVADPRGAADRRP